MAGVQEQGLAGHELSQPLLARQAQDTVKVESIAPAGSPVGQLEAIAVVAVPREEVLGHQPLQRSPLDLFGAVLSAASRSNLSPSSAAMNGCIEQRMALPARRSTPVRLSLCALEPVRTNLGD
jgi:hypothetical protein